MSDLKKNFHYYLENQDELVKRFDGRVVAIKGCRVIGDYPDKDAAIRETIKNHPMGSFIVQKVELGTKAYTQRFHSRVSFAPV